MSKMLFVIGLVCLLTISSRAQLASASLKLADGFDFPVGPPNASGYYKSRGFSLLGHLGEDWVSEDGSGTIFGRPVCSIGTGVVTLARDFLRAWGNVVVIRHAYLEDGQVKFIDSLYAHLNKISVSEGQPVDRGQQIGTVGTAHGIYGPHLHFEIHHNLTLGVVHTAESRVPGNYDDPTQFLDAHRTLKTFSEAVTVALNGYMMPSFPGIPAHPGSTDQTAGKFASANEIFVSSQWRTVLRRHRGKWRR
ncbi:MAG: M23 family metallopeptidase [Chthoniobacterales bacterium]